MNKKIAKKILLPLRHVRHGSILCKYMHNTSPTSAYPWNHQEVNITPLSKVKKRTRFPLEIQKLHRHTSLLTSRIQARLKERVRRQRQLCRTYPEIGHEMSEISRLESVPKRAPTTLSLDDVWVESKINLRQMRHIYSTVLRLFTFGCLINVGEEKIKLRQV